MNTLARINRGTRILIVLVLLASAALIACGEDDLVDPEPTPTVTAATEATTASPAPSPTPQSGTLDLSQFDPEPVPLEPSTEPCEQSNSLGRLKIGGGYLIGACATWEDTWTDELGFVIRVELLGAGTAHYLLPANAEAMFVPEDHRPSCERPGFTFSLFVLLPTGPRFVDAGGVSGICDGG